MALLQKTGWKKTIVPIKYWLLLFVLIITFLFTLIIKPLLLLIFIIFALIGLLLIRLSDIKKVRFVTDEKTIFLIIEIYIEYIWWIATFFGYLYGLRMSKEEINSY